MPELDGLEATRRILAADNAARILILTTFDLDEYVYEALQRRRERLRPQGRPSRAADRRDPHRRRRRRASLTGDHEARDQAVRAHAASRASEGARRAERARAGRLPPDRPRPLERGDRHRSSTSARRPSRRTSRTSSRSSTSATASRQSCSRTRRGSSSRTRWGRAVTRRAGQHELGLPPSPASRHPRPPAAASAIFSSAWSIVKLAAF